MLIPWPDVAHVVDSLVDLRRAVEETESPYTLETHTADFEARLWRGQAVVHSVGSLVPGHGEGHEIEAFFDRLWMPGNWTEVPHGRFRVPKNNIGFSNPRIEGGALLVTVAPGDTQTDGEVVVKAGQFCRVGRRSYRVYGLAGGTLSLIPDILPDGVALAGSSTVRARPARGSSAAANRSSDFMGPWTFSWDEWLKG